MQQAATQLYELGYRQLRPESIKPKHVSALVNHWTVEGLTPGTIKNRMSHIRWWADQVGRSSVVESNNRLGIERREYVDNDAGKARVLDHEKLEQVSDPYVKESLNLQAAFGLRREESIKINLDYAARDNELVLKSSWCKGGRERTIPINTDEQREALQRASRLAGGGSLIRPDRNYVQQLKSYERETSRVGLDRNHGLRHTYAQIRYEVLTGWKSPAAGGPKRDELTPAERVTDREVREAISQELGHNREQITAVYLGR